MNRNFGGSRGRAARIAGKVARIAPRFTGPNGRPYISRMPSGSVP